MKHFSILLTFLTVCLFLASFTPSAQADGWGETIFWEFDEQTGTLTISGTGEITVGDYDTPWDAHKEEIKRIVIQEGVTSIGYRAFYRLYQLEEVVLPQSLKSIGDYAFEKSKKLTTVDLTHITSLGDYAFQYGGLISVTIPGGITTIGRSTFFDCRQLREVILHDGITEIGYSAFEDCIALTSVRMPSTLKTIDDFAFADCRHLKEVLLNEGLETIDYSAFDGCKELEMITIPDSIQRITDTVFRGCEKLQSVYLGAGLSKVVNSAFQGCTNLTTFTVSENNPHFTVHQNALYSLADQELVVIAPGYAGDDIIPEGTVSISDHACYEGNLASITIPGTVTTIGEYAFSDCKNLKTVTLQEGVEVIEQRAFMSSGITEITFPASIKQIKFQAFLWCHNLKIITFEGLPPETEQSFSDVSATVYYPGYLDEWKDATMMREEYYLTYVPDCKDRHDLRWGETKAPTCTEPGLRGESWCIVCRKDINPAEAIPATGHSYGNWTEINAPTTEAEGLAQRACSTCGATEQKALAKLPPAAEPPVTEPSQTVPNEPPTEGPSVPPVTSPSVPERTEPTVSEPPTQTEPGLPADPDPGSWISVVTIALLSIVIGLAVSFVIFACKKQKNK